MNKVVSPYRPQSDAHRRLRERARRRLFVCGALSTAAHLSLLVFLLAPSADRVIDETPIVLLPSPSKSAQQAPASDPSTSDTEAASSQAKDDSQRLTPFGDLLAALKDDRPIPPQLALKPLSSSDIEMLNSLPPELLQRLLDTLETLPEAALADASPALKAIVQLQLKNRSTPINAASDPTRIASAEARGASSNELTSSLQQTRTGESYEQNEAEVVAALENTPAPEQEAGEEESLKEPDYLKYLQVDDSLKEMQSLNNEFIGSMDSRAEAMKSAVVTSDAAGSPTPPLMGNPTQNGTPAVEVQDGDPLADGGEQIGQGSPTQQMKLAKRGGGAEVEDPGKGAPNRERGTSGGPMATAGRVSDASLVAALVVDGSRPTAGVKESIRPDQLRPLRIEGRWSPSVSRIVVRRFQRDVSESKVVVAVDRTAREVAPVEKPMELQDFGGTNQETELNEELPLAEEELLDAVEGEAEPEPQTDEITAEPVESIKDLRADLGWGEVEREGLKPRETLPGTENEEGNRRTSPQLTSTELDLDLVPVADVVGTPLGQYRAALDKEIRANWTSVDLPIHDRALGIQGNVVVAFRIERNGRVFDKTITRSSGHTSLDMMAMASIPERLRRIPKDVEGRQVFHRYTFIYRNPLIVDGDQ